MLASTPISADDKAAGDDDDAFESEHDVCDQRSAESEAAAPRYHPNIFVIAEPITQRSAEYDQHGKS